MARYDYDDDFGFPRYVSVAERRRQSEREAKKLAKNGQTVSPVIINGSRITTTFWGKAWCENLERYSDFSNRLPRGRTYVRSGCVIDLQISPGVVTALVSGSEVYQIEVRVTVIPKARWKAVCTDCAGAIDSLVELLEGRLSKTVMTRLCAQKTGLFPMSSEIQFDCSCPDSASMCKHVAAVLYGIGARLDEKPELLFTLRKVNQQDLIAHASEGLAKARKKSPTAKVLASGELSEIFGIEIDEKPIKPKGKGRAAG